MDNKNSQGFTGNEKIESDIERIQKEPSSEALAVALTTIRRRMKDQGEFIVAMDNAAIQKKPQIGTIRSDDGARWIACFTSFEEELKGSNPVMSTFTSRISDIFDMALKSPDVSGIALNPWNRTLLLDKHLINIILGNL